MDDLGDGVKGWLFKNASKILVDAICGKEFDYEVYERGVELGLAKYTGNQWNSEWEWKRSELYNLDLPSLFLIYKGVLGGKETEEAEEVQINA